MIVVTSGHIEGKIIKQTLGISSGNTVRSRNIGKDITAAFRNIVGGEVMEYAQLLSSSRSQAIERMIEHAENMGANAVVDVRITTSAVMAGTSEILAYGTAVILEDE